MNINDLLNTTGVTNQSNSQAVPPAPANTAPPQTNASQPSDDSAQASSQSQGSQLPELSLPTDVTVEAPQGSTTVTEAVSLPEDVTITESNIQTLPPLPPTDEPKDNEMPKEISSPEELTVLETTPSSVEQTEPEILSEVQSQESNEKKLDPIVDQPPVTPTELTPSAPQEQVVSPELQSQETSQPIDDISVEQVPETSTDTTATLSFEDMQSHLGTEEPDIATSQTIDTADVLSTTTSNYPYTMNQLLEIVVQKNASDLHIGSNYPALIRVDGELQPVSSHIITPEIAKDLIFSILSEENKEVVEINKEVDVAYAFEDIARFRVNVYHSTGSMAAALRLIPNKIKTMDELKLPKIYHNFVNLKQGLVLVTGPTGHGKSTTLAAILNEVNRTKPVHIITIEDPVEYVYPTGKALVNQREMKQDTHSWDIALKSILREDPDVVLVGEMRDYETISAAITIAETGHLVFATLHTNSAAQTIDRIIDVFPEHQQGQIRTQLAVVIEGVIAQRLVKLNGGGRRAVSEVMMGTAAVRNIIREGKTYQLDNVIRTSGDIGMISIERSLVDLVREGLISVEDAQLNAVSPEEVLRLLK